MKENYKLFAKKMLILGFLVLTFTSNAQHFTITLANFTSTSNTFEVDLVLIIDQPVQGVRLSAVAAGIFYNPNILNGGTPCTTSNCGSFVAIPGSRSPELMPLREFYGAFTTNPLGHLRTTQPPTPNTGVDLLPGTYTVERFRFTNTVPWTPNTDAQLWLSPNNTNYASNSIVLWYPYGTSSPSTAYTTTSPANGAGLTLGYTQGAPMLRILNPSLSLQENQLASLQAVPNPFDATFSLDFETVSNEQVTLKVYDMIGKLIDNRTVEANNINTVRIGENYQAGIYSLVVSQGDKTQTLRVIKR